MAELITLPQFRIMNDEHAIASYLERLPKLHAQIAECEAEIEQATAAGRTEERAARFDDQRVAHIRRHTGEQITEIQRRLAPLQIERNAIYRDLPIRVERLKAAYAAREGIETV